MKTEYTNQLQREIESYPNDGGIPVIVNSTPPKPTPSSTVEGLTRTIKFESEEEYHSFIKWRFLRTSSDIISTVDLEREAEELYPDFIVVNKEGVEENLCIPERAAYIKGRQTSQKGLEELIEGIDEAINDHLTDNAICSEYVKRALMVVRNKATELLTNK